MLATMYNIICFHGLDSSLSIDKRNVLNEYGKVTAPTFNYRNLDVLNSINDMFDDIDPKSTVLIGSSFGGYLANIFSLYYDIPCLLFNPALPYRSIDLSISEPENSNIKSLSYIVLGKKDEVINANANLRFIETNFLGPTKVFVEENMGHRIPFDKFQNHSSQFFKELKINSSVRA